MHSVRGTHSVRVEGGGIRHPAAAPLVMLSRIDLFQVDIAFSAVSHMLMYTAKHAAIKMHQVQGVGG